MVWQTTTMLLCYGIACLQLQTSSSSIIPYRMYACMYAAGAPYSSSSSSSSSIEREIEGGGDEERERQKERERAREST